MGKNKDPAFLFYTADFVVGTMFMSNEQVGKYIRLLCAQHQKGHLTSEEFDSICGKDAIVRKKFELDKDGFYYNSRLDKEIAIRSNYILSQTNNGKKGGRPKKPIETHGKPTENPRVSIGLTQTKAKQKPSENENINNTLDISNTEVDSFNFSNTTTTTTTYIYLSMSEDEKAELELRICGIFAKMNSKSDPYDFIAYNKSRNFIGIGGEDVLEDLPRYIERWERRETEKLGGSR